MAGKKRRGFVVYDMIVFVIVIVVFGMISLFGYQAFQEMSDDVQGDLALNESKTIVQEVETRYPSVLDGLFMLVMLGFWAAGVVSAYMMDQHPLLFGFMMILVVFVIIAGAMLGNFFEETYQDAEYTGLTASFPMTFWVLSHMVQVSIAVVLSIVMAMLGKNSG